MHKNKDMTNVVHKNIKTVQILASTQELDQNQTTFDAMHMTSLDLGHVTLFSKTNSNSVFVNLKFLTSD